MHFMQKPYATSDDFINLAKKAGIWTDTMHKAVEQAQISHYGQLRDDGQSYLSQHIFPLAIVAANYFVNAHDKHDIVVAMLLHDVLEDDEDLLSTALQKSFSSTICSMIQGLQKSHKKQKVRTQQDKHDEHAVYVQSLRLASQPIKVMKLLDRINNLQCTEVKNNKEKYERYLRDTVELYLPLALEVDTTLAQVIIEETTRIKDEIDSLNT